MFSFFERIYFNIESIYRSMLKSILNYIYVINILVVEEDEVEFIYFFDCFLKNILFSLLELVLMKMTKSEFKFILVMILN